MTLAQRGFLAAFAATGQIGPAAAAAGIDRSTHHRWRREDSAYDELFKQAAEEAASAFEDLAIQRATEGLDEPVFYQGEPVYKRCPVTNALELDEQGLPVPLMIRRRSDTLLLSVLKAWQPKKYRENHHVEGSITHSGAAALSDAELERIARGGGGGAAAPASGEEQVQNLVP